MLLPEPTSLAIPRFKGVQQLALDCADHWQRFNDCILLWRRRRSYSGREAVRIDW